MILSAIYTHQMKKFDLFEILKKNLKFIRKKNVKTQIIIKIIIK